MEYYMIAILSFVHRHKNIIVRIVAGLVLLFLLLFVIRGLRKPAEVVQINPRNQVIFVPEEVIVYKEIIKYLPAKHRRVAKDALDSAKKNGVDVGQLGIGESTTESVGEGTVTVSTIPFGTSSQLAFTPFTFTDGWRLWLESDGVIDPTTQKVKGTYTLKQQFVITHTMGRDANNLLTNEIKLFQMGKDGKPAELDIDSFYTIATKVSDTRPRPKFYMKPTLQGGVAVLPNTVQSPTGEVSVAFSASIPWWKRGTTRAVETTRYAYLSPTATFNNSDITVGISPISFNFGTVKHLPVTDLWSSPYIGVSLKNNQKKIGIVFGTTF